MQIIISWKKKSIFTNNKKKTKQKGFKDIEHFKGKDEANRLVNFADKEKFRLIKKKIRIAVTNEAHCHYNRKSNTIVKEFKTSKPSLNLE